jgi:uncharacterized protein DUF4136
MQFQQLSRTVNLIILLIAGYTMGGCASGPSILSDYDHSAPFDSYTTYNFMEGAGPDDDNYQSFFSRYVIEAITIEMENRGYTKSDDPDLLVNFNANLQDKTKIRTTSAPPPMHGGYYGYRSGYYGAWGGYGYGTETHVSQYTEGTFNIDIVDNRTHQLVWEAVGVGRVTEKTLEKLEEVVKAGVPNYFSLYPFHAGPSSVER